MASTLANSTMMSRAGHFSPLSSSPSIRRNLCGLCVHARDRLPRMERNRLPNKVRLSINIFRLLTGVQRENRLMASIFIANIG